jgi:hypothetical protein
MNELISPKYQMRLVENIEKALWAEFQDLKYYNVEKYIEKWQIWDGRWDNGYFVENAPQFCIARNEQKKIDLKSTLHNIDGETLLKIAIDLGVDTPDFIPSIPTFKNELKSNYIIAYDTFVKAYKQIETDPSLAVGLANSALESIIKEILNDERIRGKIKGTETLYKLTTIILAEFQLFPNSDMPKEISTIGSSLLAVNQSIEKLRSEKTNVHGKTAEDYIINDSLYTYYVVNSVATVGAFLNSYYKNKFPKISNESNINYDGDELPF